MATWLNNLGIEKWKSDWSMKFNPSRNNVIQITRRRTAFRFHCKLPRNCWWRLLIFRDLPLTWFTLVRLNEITTKPNKTLNFLPHNLHTCLAKSKEQAYKALVRPSFEYSTTVWDTYVAKNIIAAKSCTDQPEFPEPGSFKTFWMYITAFASISSNQIKIEALLILKNLGIVVEEKTLFCVESHVFAGEELESKWRLYKLLWLQPI